MIIIITQEKDGLPKVTVEGNDNDRPEDVVKAYQEAQKVQPIKEYKQ